MKTKIVNNWFIIKVNEFEIKLVGLRTRIQCQTH